MKLGPAPIQQRVSFGDAKSNTEVSLSFESIAYCTEWGMFVGFLSPEECLRMLQQRPFLVFSCWLALPSAGYPVCLPPRMRERRCSWKHLCVARLAARCWEKGGNSKGAVGAGEREAARQGFPGCANVSCSLENSFPRLSVCLSVSLPLYDNRFLLLLRRSVLKLPNFQHANMSMTMTLLNALCVSPRSQDCNSICRHWWVF